MIALCACLRPVGTEGVARRYQGSDMEAERSVQPDCRGNAREQEEMQ